MKRILINAELNLKWMKFNEFNFVKLFEFYLKHRIDIVKCFKIVSKQWVGNKFLKCKILERKKFDTSDCI